MNHRVMLFLLLLHKPHPEKELRDYQIKQLIAILEGEGLI